MYPGGHQLRYGDQQQDGRLDMSLWARMVVLGVWRTGSRLGREDYERSVLVEHRGMVSAMVLLEVKWWRISV